MHESNENGPRPGVFDVLRVWFDAGSSCQALPQNENPERAPGNKGLSGAGGSRGETASRWVGPRGSSGSSPCLRTLQAAALAGPAQRHCSVALSAQLSSQFEAAPMNTQLVELEDGWRQVHTISPLTPPLNHAALFWLELCPDPWRSPALCPASRRCSLSCDLACCRRCPVRARIPTRAVLSPGLARQPRARRNALTPNARSPSLTGCGRGPVHASRSKRVRSRGTSALLSLVRPPRFRSVAYPDDTNAGQAARHPGGRPHRPQV